MSNEDFKRDWGMEITWADEETYCGKILIFTQSKNATPFHFHKDTCKSWFVNNGQFIVRWIDTADGKVYQTDLNEGSTFKVNPLTPVSLECIVSGSSIAQTSNKNDSNDYYTLMPISTVTK